MSNKAQARPDWFPLGVSFKLFDKHPWRFCMGTPLPPGHVTNVIERLHQASSRDRGKKCTAVSILLIAIPLEQVFFCLSLALHLSSAAGHDDCVHILLHLHNADGSLRDCSGQTAQDLALKPAVQRMFEPVAPWMHLFITMQLRYRCHALSSRLASVHKFHFVWYASLGTYKVSCNKLEILSQDQKQGTCSILPLASRVVS